MINRNKRKEFRLLFFILLPFIFFACTESPEEKLERIAKETNKQCPQVVDPFTAMVSCEALPGRLLKFTYRANKEFDITPSEAHAAEMKMVLIEKLKQRKEVAFYRENDVRFEHLFLSDSGDTIMNVKIESIDYK